MSKKDEVKKIEEEEEEEEEENLTSVDEIYQHYKTGNKLFLGNIDASKDLKWLTANNITHIVQCVLIDLNTKVEKRVPFHGKFKYEIVDVGDYVGEDLRKHFPRVLKFIDEGLLYSKGNNVLVHCMAGASRSVTFVVAYLMRLLGLGLQSSLSLVKKKRSVANPNFGFIRQLRKFEDEISTKVMGKKLVMKYCN